MPQFDVVGLGYCSLDYLCVVDAYPSVDSKTETLHMVEEGGGPTATALVTLARLGVGTLFVRKVGDDARGKLIVKQLEGEGVDISCTRFEENRTSQLSLVVVERQTGKRTIIYTRGSVSQLKPEELDRRAITSGRILHIDGHQMGASIVAAQWAREADMKVILDAGSVRPGMETLVEWADYVVASKSFALAFTSEVDIRKAAKKLLRSDVKAAVVTAGEEGGFCVSDEGAFAYPAFQVEVVDTTGAGDVFHSAFDYGILRGWNLRSVVRFASAVAALKCRKLGGRSGIPSLEEARQFLDNREALRNDTC